VAMAALAHAAGPEAPPRAVRIEYEAAAGCPDERGFEGQVRARLATKIVASPEGASSVRVRIAPHGPSFEGDIVLTDPKGHESRRRVEGRCADVTAALALITALALDPAASTASDPSSETQTAPALPAPASSTPAPSPPSAAGPSPPKPTAPAAARESREDVEPASRSEALSEDGVRGGERARGRGWGVSIGAGAGLTTGVAPRALLSIPAFLDVWRRSTSAFAPALRLRFERADSGADVTSGGSGGDFTWTAGSVDFCPVSWAPWRFRLWPCARAEGGALSATGVGVSPARTQIRSWFTLGLVARARVMVVGSLFLEIEGGGFAPLIRDRFFVDPGSTTVQRAPSVAAAGAADVGVTFW